MIRFIELTNCQSHAHFLIELPAKGIIRFTGDNNQGKSVYTKYISDFLRGKYTSNPKKRKGMIRYEKTSNGQGRIYSPFAECKITQYNGKILLIHLELEAKNCWVKYWNERGEETCRYFSEGNYMHLAREFGYHYSDKYGISLNVYRTYDPLPGATTTYTANREIVDEAVTDPYLEAGVNGLTETIEETDSTIKMLVEMETRMAAELSAIDVYDEAYESKMMETFVTATKIIEGIDEEAFVLEPIEIPTPFVMESLELIRSTTPIGLMSVPSFPKPPPAVDEAFISAIKPVELPDVFDMVMKIKETRLHRDKLKKSECPTCGRSFI